MGSLAQKASAAMKRAKKPIQVDSGMTASALCKAHMTSGCRCNWSRNSKRDKLASPRHIDPNMSILPNFERWPRSPDLAQGAGDG